MTQAKKAIYALVDPDTGADRYVGCTKDVPKNRLSAHINDALHIVRRKGPGALTAKHAWICDLARDGKRPTIRVIEWVVPISAPVKEAYWIRRLHAEGADLFNVNSTTPIPATATGWHTSVRKLISGWSDSQARGGVSRDFQDAMTDLAMACGLPVPEFHGTLDGAVPS